MVPPSAIISVTTFQRLQHGSTIGFEYIQPGRKTKQIAKAIADQKHELTPKMAMEIGMLVKEMLGINNDINRKFTGESLPAIVEQVVESIVNAFSIGLPTELSKEEMVCNRICFSRTFLGSRAYVEEVEDAFERGVERGIQTTEFYSRRRSNGRV